ncbi:Ig-like domain-containing protein, partial [Neobacillus drentensis]|uniref:Ig-like domain-containing protein n=1 Tax=Neobacillus drentensis TaxID=220684 RepID=UPI0030011C22
KADIPNPIAPTVTATNITMESNSLVYVGRKLQLNATVEPANFTNSITWSSDNTDVAVVNSKGVVTGKAEGTATIKATIDGYEASCVVTVQTNPATGISLDHESAFLTVPNDVTLQLNATVSPADTTDVVTWNSSNTNIADVDENGLVTAKYDGEATITASIGSFKAECVVKVDVDSATESNGFTAHFDNGLDGFGSATSGQGWDNIKWTKDFDTTGNGGGSVVLDGSDGGSPNAAPNSWIYRSLKLPKNQSFDLNLKYRDAQGGGDALVRIRVVSRHGEKILQPWTLANDDTWHELDFDLSEFAGEYITLYLEQNDSKEGGGEFIYFDDIILVEK